MIDIWTILFVVLFDYRGVVKEMSIEFDTVEQCFEHKKKVDKDPSVLFFEKKHISKIEYGCVRYLKKYVEECELLPMDYVNKKECIPYWEHWSNHSRSESGTYQYKEQ